MIRIITVAEYQKIDYVSRKSIEYLRTLPTPRIRHVLACLNEADKQPGEEFEFEQPYPNEVLDQPLLGHRYFKYLCRTKRMLIDILAERALEEMLMPTPDEMPNIPTT